VSGQRRTVIAVPKSRGRKPTKKPPAKRRPSRAPAARLQPNQYNVGRVRSSLAAIDTLLTAHEVSPDLLVELLPAMLLLEQGVGHPLNFCVSGCATLHYAYAELGIEAYPRPVDLVVSNQRTGQRTLYGRPDPYWSGSTFHGHCVIWLPASRRFIDPTVEQYPEVRRYRLGPICGRIGASLATAEQQARFERGELTPGTAVGVQRDDLLLLYTTVDHEFTDSVLTGPGIVDNLAEIQAAGATLAAQVIVLLREPEVITRARQASHARVRALLDLLADAEVDLTEDDVRFVLPGDPARLPRRLAEIDLPPADGRRRTPHEIPAPRPVPSDDRPTAVRPTEDETPPSPPRRRGLLARLRRQV
jgi:hypothetical protein